MQGRGRGKPLPRGLKPEGLKRRGVENRYTTLNHPSPEGWWDFKISDCPPIGVPWVHMRPHGAPSLLDSDPQYEYKL